MTTARVRATGFLNTTLDRFLQGVQDLAKRTVGIFHYPKDSDPALVSQHAKTFGSQFGEVLRVFVKWGSGAQPYAILNFASREAADAAVGQRPVFMGTPVDPTPWRLPKGMLPAMVIPCPSSIFVCVSSSPASHFVIPQSLFVTIKYCGSMYYFQTNWRLSPSEYNLL